RAALQCALVMAALLLQRPAHARTLMGAAALVLLVLQPLNALDAGFQLSFAGVAGLLAYRRRLIELLPEGMPAPLRDGLGTGIAATAATFPIAALHFGQFAPVGLFATIVASPLVALALPGIALLLLLGPVAPAFAAWIAPGVELLLGGFLAVARAAAAVPGGHFAIASSTLAALLIAAAAALIWWAHLRAACPLPAADRPAATTRNRTTKVLRALQAGAAALALLAWTPRLIPTAGAVELHFIDVGQGDAIALRTPAGRWLLVDAGVRTDRMDMGARRVVPYLLRQGARQLDVLLLTHADADHIGGAVSVLRALRVGTVLDPGVPGGTMQYLQTLRAAAAEPARWFAPRAGDQLAIDGVLLRFLHPVASMAEASTDPNDHSLVFRLSFGGFAALFPGDAPQHVEAGLAADLGAGLAAQVLKVGHHGSRTATAPALLDAVNPRLAIVSVGRDNRYGHPDPDVLDRLVHHGARVLRTDQHGSIVIRAWRSGRVQLGTAR
ncbi:MAG: ComEC/Rec2 family competence protein, partial [Gemmatimonadetes bacterium]|nr:ComEC/Rec2 family competence protein [Gemmatimonadota bacterium]